MPDLSIRLATIADAELLSELAARTFSETFGSDNTAENMSLYMSAAFNPLKQTAELSDPNGWGKIAELDGDVTGYAMMNAGAAPAEITGGNPIELVRLYVTQESIGRGIGAALMTDCIDEAKKRCFDTLWLGVWEHNYRAQSFYRKWGFVEVGTHNFQLGDDAQKDFLMQKDLTVSA